MAYTPIQPLPTVTNPLLGIAKEGLSYIRQVNEIKKQENQKRQDEIIKLLGDVDFPTATEMVNRKKQMEIYGAGENALMATLAKSAKNNGVIGMQDRLEQERIVRTMEQELVSIKNGEDRYKKKMEEIAKIPGQYTLESMNRFNDLYLKEGEYREDMLEYTPVPFSVVDNAFYAGFKNLTEPVLTLEKGQEVTRDVVNMPVEEKQANYQSFKAKLPGLADYELQTFRALKEQDPAMYNKYKQEGIDERSAADMWAMDEVAPKLGTGRVKDVRFHKTAKTGQDKVQDVKGIEMEDGSTVYKIPPVRVDDQVNVYGEGGKMETMTLNGAKVFEGGYGKLPDGTMGKYFKVIARKEIPAKGMTPASTVTDTYIVPYEELASRVKREVNLLDIDKLESKETKVTESLQDYLDQFKRK